jgi:hypothetical protein
MSRIPWLNKKCLVAVVAFVVLLAGSVTYLERTALLSWYYVRGLAKADPNSQAVWAERVAGLGEDAIPGLLKCLTDSDATVCCNARAGLAQLAKHWGIGDSRTVALAMRCGREFTHFSAAGQQNLLDLAADWFRSPSADTSPAQGLLAACVRLLSEAASSTDGGTQGRALELCDVLLAQPQGAEALSAGREVVRSCLASEAPGNRVRAVDLTRRPGMDLFEQVTPLLRDPVAEVRRSAMATVGDPASGVIDDALLPSLHDDDAEVQQLCFEALVKRERTPQQIRLGYLLTDKNPAMRVQVVDYLPQLSDLDPALWLTPMSHDESPAVRAAAARAMSRLCLDDQRLKERLKEMAASDPSATVCLLAKYYLDNPEKQLTTGVGPRAPNSCLAKVDLGVPAEGD